MRNVAIIFHVLFFISGVFLIIGVQVALLAFVAKKNKMKNYGWVD